jgi:hypothetical protein
MPAAVLGRFVFSVTASLFRDDRWGSRRWFCNRIRLFGLPPGGESQLRRAGDAHGENQERPGQGRAEQGDGHGHLPIGPEEFNPHGASVLHDEIDQGDTQHGRDGHGDPYPADPGVVDAVAVRVPSMRASVPLLAGDVLGDLFSGPGLNVG